ncbi:MAG: hypothetical protein K2I33_01255, partial [Oscillospiraceae bacterium]|nr:hypothetical protein [Oscillospiraceae bacterium]
MNKRYRINANCNIKKLEEQKVLVQSEGSFKILECSYDILSDVLNLISNEKSLGEIITNYIEKFDKNEVINFVDTLCAEGIISPQGCCGGIDVVNVLLVGEGAIFNYIKSGKWNKVNVVEAYTTEQFLTDLNDVNVPYDTVIFAPGNADYKTFRSVNDSLVKKTIPFIPIYCTGESYICGPYVFPWQTPCLECGFTHHIKAVNRANNDKVSIDKIDDVPLSKENNCSDLSEQLKYLVELLIRDIVCVKKEETDFIFYKKELCFKENIEDGYCEKKYQPITDCECCHGMNKNFIKFSGAIEVPSLNSPFSSDDIKYNVGGLRSKTEKETEELISKAVNDLGLNIEIKLVENNIFNSVLPVYDSMLKTMQKNKTPHFLDGGKSHGKGLNKKQAYFSAAFELFERMSSRYYGTETIIRATPKDVQDYCIDLDSITRQVPNVATVYD